MIKRHYFMAVSIDGEPGYAIYTMRSFFPDVEEAFEFGLNKVYEWLTEGSSQQLTVTAFNRV